MVEAMGTMGREMERRKVVGEKKRRGRKGRKREKIGKTREWHENGQVRSGALVVSEWEGATRSPARKGLARHTSKPVTERPSLGEEAMIYGGRNEVAGKS